MNIPPSMYSAITMRILGGFFSDNFLYIAFTYMSYSKGICLFFMNTLMIPLFARCILKEPILKADGVGIAIGFVGMILIVQPFKEEVKSSEITGAIFALIAAVGGSMSIVFMRKMA